jgi:hypothetical protein
MIQQHQKIQNKKKKNIKKKQSMQFSKLAPSSSRKFQIKRRAKDA